MFYKKNIKDSKKVAKCKKYVYKQNKIFKKNSIKICIYI